MARLRKLSPGSKPTWRDFNIMVDRVNAMGNVKGRNGIRVSQSQHGLTLVGTPGGAASAGTSIHKAYAASASGRFTSIPGFLDTDTTGNPITISVR
jgi:hypothetical protein